MLSLSFGVSFIEKPHDCSNMNKIEYDVDDQRYDLVEIVDFNFNYFYVKFQIIWTINTSFR